MKLSARFAALLVGGLLLLPAIASAKAADEDVEIVDHGDLRRDCRSEESVVVCVVAAIVFYVACRMLRIEELDEAIEAIAGRFLRVLRRK